MTSVLPSHRQLLTSLFTSLCHNTQTQSEGGSLTPQPTSCNSRVGNSLFCDRRRLFLTLHAIFHDTVLPALDLIDRRLVVRVIATKNLARQGERPPADLDLNDSSAAVYLVHSRASNKTYRVAHGSTQTPKFYLVQLDAWHCSCPNFAMDTFTGRLPSLALKKIVLPEQPSVSSSPLSSSTTSQAQRCKQLGWSGSFGRTSLDGLKNLGESAPCCRHLLACLLLDIWDSRMGHAHVWRYTKEEIAGLVLCA